MTEADYSGQQLPADDEQDPGQQDPEQDPQAAPATSQATSQTPDNGDDTAAPGAPGDMYHGSPTP